MARISRIGKRYPLDHAQLNDNGVGAKVFLAAAWEKVRLTGMDRS